MDVLNGLELEHLQLLLVGNFLLLHVVVLLDLLALFGGLEFLNFDLSFSRLDVAFVFIFSPAAFV